MPIDAMSVRHFKKAYSRNFPILLQEAWFSRVSQMIVDFGGDPSRVLYISHTTDGTSDFWENEETLQWLLSQISERIKSDEEFYFEVYNRYVATLAELEIFWEREITTVPELHNFLDVVQRAIQDFLILYAGILDESISDEFKKIANEFRENDALFSKSADTLWKALGVLFPDFAHLTTYLTRAELESEITKTELMERDRGFLFAHDAHAETVSFENLSAKFPQYVFKKEIGEREGESLKGQAAFGGYVVGKVRIVRRRDQVDAVEDGEVMVSPMTTPEMILAMKKAVAFVTDEGGIMCHAAIIAREMKKPCVVGTKVATQLFKDGDLVAVDASKGLVKRL